MFRVLTRKRKRRLSSPRIVALSVGAHLLLLVGVVASSTAAMVETRPEEQVVDEWDIAKPAPPPPAPDEPQQPDTPPPPTPGETVELPAPTTVPTEIPQPKLDEQPLLAVHVTGDGAPGDVFGPRPAEPTPPTRQIEPTPNPPFQHDGVYTPEMVEETPRLANGSEVARLFERFYPRVLADQGVAGRVMLELIVDADGRVRPGSVRVVSATNPQFSDATLRIVERFRFRPAHVGDQAVPVMVTIPIDWKPEQS
ncbi:MAG TPA: TonB family protein [Longimicrobium sp.]|jgi:TonB family protein